jgi:cysteine synthase
VPIYDDVTALIGNTPLVRINRIIDSEATVAAKLEFYNPANSVKDRIGVSIIDAAEASGELQPGGTIVEATSGNTGIALAMVGAARGYNVVLAMPETMSLERKTLLRAYGAELVLTPGSEGMKGAVAKADEIAQEREPCGPASSPMPRTPTSTVARRARGDLEGHRRRGRHLRRGRRHRRHDHGSARSSRRASRVSRMSPWSRRSPHPQRRAARPAQDPGHRRQLRPRDPRPRVYDEVIDVNAGHGGGVAHRKAATEEGLLVGISSGAALAAANEVARRPENAGKKIVVIIPSFGERYLSTILFEGLGG